MNTQLLNDNDVVYYAVMVAGRVVSGKYTDRFSAEQAKQALPVDQQKLAEVQVVDQSNRQLWLG